MPSAVRVEGNPDRVAVRVLTPIAASTVSYRPGAEATFALETAARLAERGYVKILPTPEEALVEKAKAVGAGLLLKKGATKEEEARNRRIRSLAKGAGVRVADAGRGRSVVEG